MAARLPRSPARSPAARAQDARAAPRRKAAALRRTAAPAARSAPTATPPRRPDAPDWQALLNDPAQWARLMWEKAPQVASLEHLAHLGEAAPALPYRLDPNILQTLQTEYAASATRLWSEYLEGRRAATADDRRFDARAWQGMHRYLADIYLLNARYLKQLAENLEADPKTLAKIRFAVEQFVDALSPANFLATNPEAQERIIATQGESLALGLVNMLCDLHKGRISQTDESAFQVGRNVAVTAGDVVFQNEVMQVIQYRPTTATVFERPLLIVPPCINKFYILDLQPENSLVAHTVAQGHTVFLVSWRNPGPAQAHLTWDDYIASGVIQAIRVVQAIGRQPSFNLLGFCVGGTMLATALAVLAAQGEHVATSLTLLTTLLDFSNTGILDVFVDEAQVRMREQTIGGMGAEPGRSVPPGLMPARELAASFSFLRPNDLVWNYVVRNYLKGETPPAFDLLYWNADSTNLPGPYFAWYLRHTYLENRLKDARALTVCGVPVDLGAVAAPVYVYGSREDHIVPWTAAYASLALFPGPRRFVLGASGHIAGVINPPAKRKRSHWLYPVKEDKLPKDPQAWLAAAREEPGSWWPDWHAWLGGFGGRQKAAPKQAGNSRYRPLEPAPGSYVTVRAV